jgi:uncharacterized integral membrane protein (TIGR00698 family)
VTSIASGAWRSGRRLQRKTASTAPGLVAAVLVAAPALGVAVFLPLVGAPVLGLAFGIAVALVRRPSAHIQLGLRFTARVVLQLGIVALGATLSLGVVGSVGLRTLPVMLGTLAVALGVAVVAGRALGVPNPLRTLVGVGTGICGASAIAAVSGIIGAAEAEVAYAISTIFVFNIVAVVLFPPLGHLFGMSQSTFGLWAGTAINDTSSVVAAGYAYGSAAGAHAVVVKLTRTTMIVPIVLALALRRGRGVTWRETIPWFLVAFTAAAALRTAGVVPESSTSALKHTAVVLVTVALAAIGLSTRVSALRRAGPRPLLLGLAVWCAVALTSLAIQLVAPA